MKKYLYIVLLIGACFGNDKLEKARLLHDAGLYKDAKIILTNLVSESKDDKTIDEALFTLGTILVTEKQYKNAFKVFKRLYDRSPDYRSEIIVVFPDYSIRDKSSTLIGYNVHPNPKQGSFEAHAYKVDFGVKMTEQYGLKIVQKNYDINGIYKDSDIININEIELNQLYEKLKELVIKQSGDFKLGADQSFREYIFPSGLSIDISSSKKPPWSNVMIGKRGDWITVKNMGEFSQVINKAVTKVKEMKSK